ncbi:MAG: amino acid permease, partial [Desulfoferrobacter sp.]
AICGNDITSSCLYVSAIAAVYAGVLAPVVLLFVGIVLYLYKKIYTEVVEALPLNGGAYNCLLNCTSKLSASVAACMTILSYIATAVISSKTAAEYLHHLLPTTNVIYGTLAILFIFAILTLSGITESAVVALIIFVFYMISLTVFCVIGFTHFPSDFYIFKANWSTLPEGSMLVMALFLGFSSALLGISGFESSANFVEEQVHGVFRKTLRNMWIAVIILSSSRISVKRLCHRIDVIPSGARNLVELPSESGFLGFRPRNDRERFPRQSAMNHNIFIGAPEQKHSFSIEDLGGVRVIF